VEKGGPEQWQQVSGNLLGGKKWGTFERILTKRIRKNSEKSNGLGGATRSYGKWRGAIGKKKNQGKGKELKGETASAGRSPTRCRASCEKIEGRGLKPGGGGGNMRRAESGKRE